MKRGTKNNADWHYIRLSTPQRDGFVESFNNNLMDELLKEEWFNGLG